MVGEPIYFGRKYRLTIEIPESGGDGGPTAGTKVFVVEAGKPAMDIKFDVTYARGQTAREGTISILGLGYETIHDFLSLAAETRGKAMSQLVRVKLDAGYFTQAGMTNILNGFAWYATVTTPPTMWLNIKVSEYNPLGGRKADIEDMGEQPIHEIIGRILSKFNEIENEGGSRISFTMIDKTKEQKIAQGKEKIRIEFPSRVTLAEAVQTLNTALSDKYQFILRSPNESNVRVLECLDKDQDKHLEEDVIVDKDNGLLSVTGIDAVNGCITTFLDGRWADELSHLDLTSELNPQATGRYYIIKKQYVGHFMGQEWYSRYFCSARVKEGQPQT